MTFGKASEFSGGGGFFEPPKHMTALGILLEPKSVARNQPHTYRGQSSVRDELIADISIFSDQAALESGKPTEILKAVKVTQKYLVKDADAMLNGGISAAGVVIQKTQTQGGEAYVWRDAPGDVTQVIKNYYEARAEAAAGAPGFD